MRRSNVSKDRVSDQCYAQGHQLVRVIFNLDTDHHRDKTCSRASPMQNTYMVVSTVFIDLTILGTQ